jgi:hypothetical protein
MLEEQHTFPFSNLGYRDAVLFLKLCDRYTEYHKTLPMEQIISEANFIKQHQTILTE